MIQDNTEYQKYTKDQEIHDLKDIINSLESKIESLEKQLSIPHVVGQSEQLLAYTEFLREELHLNISDTWVESYIKNSK